LRTHTSQVAVDVRSPVAGVIAEVHVKVDETVKVGANLFTVSTDGAAVAAAASGAAAAAPVAAAPVAAAPAPAAAAGASALAPAKPHARKVSMQFRYGKRDAIAGAGAPVAAAVAAAAAGSAVARASAAAPQPGSSGDYNATLAALFPSKPGALDALALPPRHGRPAVSAAEAALVNSGGAYADDAPPPPPKRK